MKTYEVEVNGEVYIVKLREVDAGSVPTQTSAPQVAAPAPAPVQTAGTEVTAPMSGKILNVAKQVGDSVKKGEDLFILEAMKMETAIQAPADGKVQAINVSANQTVETDDVLMII